MLYVSRAVSPNTAAEPIATNAARKLLRKGQTDEAVKLLNACFARQFAEADAFMIRLNAAAMAGKDGKDRSGAPR